MHNKTEVWYANFLVIGVSRPMKCILYPLLCTEEREQGLPYSNFTFLYIISYVNLTRKKHFSLGEFGPATHTEHWVK